VEAQVSSPGVGNRRYIRRWTYCRVSES